MTMAPAGGIGPVRKAPGVAARVRVGDPRCRLGPDVGLPGRGTGKHSDSRMNMKRMRGRNHRGGGSGGGGGGGGGPIRHHGGGIPLNRNHVFDSNGPDMRVPGTAQQLFEKYLQLGRDATSSGDRVMAESYFQHAEHYFRILNAMNQAAQQGQQGGPQQQRRPTANEQQSGDGGGEGETEEVDGQPAGVGDQPGGGGESREIPIAAAPPGS
jgi:hypothetical protein